MKIYCKFTAESACKRILRSVNVWLSYRKEIWFPHALWQCVWTLSCWKMKNSPNILSMARHSCC